MSINHAEQLAAFLNYDEPVYGPFSLDRQAQTDLIAARDALGLAFDADDQQRYEAEVKACQERVAASVLFAEFKRPTNVDHEIVMQQPNSGSPLGMARNLALHLYVRTVDADENEVRILDKAKFEQAVRAMTTQEVMTLSQDLLVESGRMPDFPASRPQSKTSQD